ncbi:hypothetical protein KY290_010987 [Solanum tuberosum]|uniref:Uncharacterized protein n=1 Tax=Solanum tuberosum TaxID=4113 RepID=A0ABQ7W1C6_SOLTU|nr:hypothetical protein KY290_010987 [Solanum tuberosum]
MQIEVEESPSKEMEAIERNSTNSTVCSLSLKEEDSESSRVKRLLTLLLDKLNGKTNMKRPLVSKESLDEVRRFDRGKSVEGQDGSGEIYTPSGNPMAWVPPPAGRPTMPPFSPTGYPLGVNFMPQNSSNMGQNSHPLPTG